MDRLPHLSRAAAQVAAVLAFFTSPATLLSGCGGGDAEQGVPRRVDAVAAAPKAPVDLDAFCEVRRDAASAPEFAWPELATPAPTMSKGWTWVNVWATWCGPCVEELPMILSWPEALADGGATVDIALLSADEADATVSGFRVKHPWLPTTGRTARPGVVPGWLSDLGLDLPATLPLHLFVDPEGRVRCARSGALQRDDRDAIATLVAAG